jgi:DNA mismatch repair protein MutL
MADRIQLLPAALADQIAAGEVVERPSSVVKELVENAVDAGARRIDVEIERGGLGRISVSDDGEGMSPEDAHLALRRHATSKLRRADELFALSSFGFRGEALPSIASISELVLTTRTADRTAAYELTVRAGEVQRAREVGAPSGTRVEVRELFGNVPARLKFQKTVSVEASHVVDALARLSLGAPGVHLRLRVDGRLLLELPAERALAERAAAVLRRTGGRSLRIASASVTEGAIVAEVHVAAPDHALQTSRRLHVLVNERAVRDRGLSAAAQLGYGAMLPRGRYPLAVIALRVPRHEVDVNVHPQKLEVRLQRAAEAYAAVRHAVAKAVADAGFAADVALEPEARYATHFGAAEDETFEYVVPDGDALEPMLEHGPERGRAYELLRSLAGTGDASDAAAFVEATPRFLACVRGGFLVLADRRGLVVVDQHAASCWLRAADTPPADEAALDALIAGAVSPTVVLARDAAQALVDALYVEVGAGRLVLDEAEWRGRHLALRVSAAELARRLES